MAHRIFRLARQIIPIFIILSTGEVLVQRYFSPYGKIGVWSGHLALSFCIGLGLYFWRTSQFYKLLKSFFFKNVKPEQNLQYFLDLVRNAPDPIVTLDSLGNILSLNVACERALGYSPHEVIGQHFSKINVVPPESLPNAFAEISQLMSGQVEITKSEYELITKSKNRIRFESKSTPIKIKNQIVGIEIILRDVSEHQRFIGELSKRENKYRQLIENLGSEFIIYSHDGGGVFNYLSPSIKNLLGYSIETFIGQYSKAIFEKSNAVLDSEDKHVPKTFFLEVLDHTDKPHVLEVDEVPFFDDQGNFKGIEGVAHDLTVCRHTELNQRYESKIVKNIISIIPHYVFWKDRNSVYLGCNEKFAEAAGLKSTDEIVGKTDYDLVWKTEESESYRVADQKVMETGQALINFEETQLQADGRELTVLTSKMPLKNENGEVEGVLGIYSDISELKTKETKLKLQSAALESAFSGIIIVDINGKIEWVNPAFTRITGYSMEEAVGQNPRILKSGFTSNEVYADLWKTVICGKVWMGEMVNRRKDGSCYTEELTVAPVRNNDGITTHFIGVKQDITQRKNKESELLLFRSLIDQASDALFIFDFGTGHFVDVNEQACHVLGYSKSELLEKSESEIQAILGGLSSIRNPSGKTNQKEIISFETTLLSKSNVKVPADISTRYTVINKHEYLIISVRNISEKKRLEELYRQSQKMEAIGRLAGGIAHDFNNLLTVINGNAELSFAELSPEDERRNDIAEILNAGKMAAILTNQLLTFSRRQTINALVVDANDVIRKTLSMIGRIIGEDIELVFNPGEMIDPIRVDPVQIEQVLMNLAVNSRDAMPNGGKIIIETKSVRLPLENQILYGIKSQSGRFICLSFKDTGCGIPDAVKQKIFEPFFTTKPKGEGSGLGLATCYGIVKQSGGAITFTSSVGVGTEFNIFIPTINEALSPQESTENKLTLSSVKKGKVFVVEDEPSVRKLVSKLLSSQGYLVVQAENGSDAIEMIRKGDIDDFDLLITDVVMPKMGGRELVTELRRDQPDIKVIFMSGYTNQTIDNSDILAPNTEFIRKPFAPTDFVKKVSTMFS